MTILKKRMLFWGLLGLPQGVFSLLKFSRNSLSISFLEM